MKVLILLIITSAFAFGQVNHIVEVSNFVFSPQDLTIALGDTVEWRWIEGIHTTTSDSLLGLNSWDAVLSPLSQTFKIVLTAMGVHYYHCTPHQLMGMVGSITVTASVPVELTLFTVDLIERNILLRWSTATETNNQGFEVQRRKDDTDYNNSPWQKISFISGAGTTTKSNYYSFIDYHVSLPGIYVYRLKQIDMDGTFAYSKTILINYLSDKEFSLDQNYPNPFNPNTIINFSLPKDGFITLKLFDALGREVETLLNEFQYAGSHQLQINSNFINGGLQSGIYYYNLTSGNYSSTKKMILLK